MKINYVYKITNLVNGKYYIGKHSTDDIDDNYFGSGILLRDAFKKYGKENFKKDILRFFDSEDEAFEFEAELVTMHEVKSQKCYNLRPGGEGSMKGENCIWYGRKHSPETKKKMSAWKRLGHSLETRRKMSEKAKKRFAIFKDRTNKKIQMIDPTTNEVLRTFESAVLANAFFGKGCKNSNIKGCAQRRQETAYGYKWKYID